MFKYVLRQCIVYVSNISTFLFEEFNLWTLNCVHFLQDCELITRNQVNFDDKKPPGESRKKPIKQPCGLKFC